MKKSSKQYLLLLLLSFFTSITKANEVTMAFSLDIPPYIFQKYDKGIEIDMINAALAVKGHVLKPLYFPLGRIPLAFQNKSVDATMGDMGIDLAKHGGFYADPAIIYENIFITLQENNLTLKTPEDLDDLTVVSFQGAEKRYPEWLTKTKEEKRFYGISNQNTQVKLLLLNRYDVVLSDKYIFQYFLKKIGAENDQQPPLLSEHVFSSPDVNDYRPVFRDQKIRDDFNFGLAKIKQTGQFQKIYDFYLE